MTNITNMSDADFDANADKKTPQSTKETPMTIPLARERKTRACWAVTPYQEWQAIFNCVDQ